jgi:hypothetical protein
MRRLCDVLAVTSCGRSDMRSQIEIYDKGPKAIKILGSFSLQRKPVLITNENQQTEQKIQKWITHDTASALRTDVADMQKKTLIKIKIN